jgi:2-methylcitrate dehydratase
LHRWDEELGLGGAAIATPVLGALRRKSKFMDDITEKLSLYASGVHGGTLSDRVRAEVGRRLVDSLACACGALNSEPVVMLHGLARSFEIPSGCSIWGTGHRSTPEMAAIANGTAIRFLDQNDYTVGGHPSDNIAAIVAACEWVDATVDDLVAGIVVNYEVFGELGRLLIRYRGWDQGTTAVIAAACAIGRVMGLSISEIAHAVGMVATGNIATGKVRRGQLSMWKGVAGPYASACAFTAASMARSGITAPHDAFAGEFGFFEQISGPFGVERLDPTEAPWYIFQAGFKYFPVQFDAQAAVWLGQKIRAAVAVDDIRAIDVETSEWTWKGIGSDPTKWAPSNRETADHSLPFILAVAIETGGIGSDDFSDESINDPVYRRIMELIRVRAADDITQLSREYCTMRASVEMADGSHHDYEVSEPRSKAMTDDELDHKWMSLVQGSLDAERAELLYASLRRLDGKERVRSFVEPLTTAT